MSDTLEVAGNSASSTADDQTPAARRSRGKRIVSGMLTVLIGVAAVAFAIAAVAVGTGHWKASPVLSGSMEPTLHTGGIVFTQREPVADLEVGDIVMFQRPDGSDKQVVHRIVAIEQGEDGPILTTKGDANEFADPWHATPVDDTAWVAHGGVPFVGRAAVAAQAVSAWMWVAIGAGLVLLYTGIRLLRSDKATAGALPGSID